MIALLRDVDREWMRDAACRGAENPNQWHPRAGLPTAETIAICKGCCPVREACADYADANGERYGVWGGLNVGERNRRARQREVRS